MRDSQRSDKQGLLESLTNEIQRRLPEERSTQLCEFANIYYATAALGDLLEWNLDDLYGSTLLCWEFLQRRTSEQVKIRVFNPDYEQHGWQSTHTIIEVVLSEMPFVVDSLRMELNRRNLTIHAIHNAVLTLQRDDDGELSKLFGPGSRARNLSREVLVSIEIDRHTDESQLQDLKLSLMAVLEDVRIVVEDFEAMSQKCDMLAETFTQKLPHFDHSDLREVHDFIRWLKQHFTFLGYDEFSLEKVDGEQTLVPVAGSQLGLLKSCDDDCRSSLTNVSQRDAAGFVLIPEILSFTKANSKSHVHRPTYPDYISIKKIDADGKVVGECRFLGLYTSNVYIQSSRQIPVVRRKVDEVMDRSGLHRYGHDWKELLQILEIHPRDDLFQVGVEQLYETVSGVLQIHERRQIRLFMRKDAFGQFFSCLVYSPREIYSTDFRHRVEAILCEHLNATQVDFTTYFSESVLARTQLILRGEHLAQEYDANQLEKLVRRAARSWLDDLRDALVETLGEETGTAAWHRLGQGLPASYRNDFTPRTAVVDIQHLRELSVDHPLQLSFYRALERSDEHLNLKLFSLENSLPLSDLIPVLENLGLRVLEEHPYLLETAELQIWIHDFTLSFTGSGQLAFADLKDVFEEAFLHIWQGHASSDDFNRLVMNAQIPWRCVAMLRAYAAYMKQIRFPISTEAISNTLNSYVDLAKLLVQLFHARFDPNNQADTAAIEQQIMERLEEVVSLNDDRVVRQYLALIKATLRTNFYQHGSDGLHRYFSFKIAPEKIPGMPLPKPRYEIFIYAPWVEGVHLRGGKVARGGLRWSDRYEDFRTEVLGLVKAQQVKNAVIVPVGAKGGFVAKLLRDDMNRDEWLAEGIRCYQTFICGLLDITDNRSDAAVIPPLDVVRHDDDDAYLVVAADKGTATFSDIANEIAQQYGFWLGDAFASGGSQGYDHKKMGITAKGAWVSVQRHFREIGLNTDQDDFTVLGIGDMSGDVFGNGLLLSKHTCLVAAFNHQHIFIDPTPDAARSWKERKRMFDLPRSSWQDYDTSLISQGGGIFSRSSKSIQLSPQIKTLTGLSCDRITPTDLIRALLIMPVDLLWNGGIGTYVKATDETDIQIGDKANDALRVNGAELRCKVVGEGGNLGLSQRARIEYALKGGRLNTDFIDNAGGVDCSDHEVNIKILLSQIVLSGDMTEKQRNQLLENMTEEVSALVLENNYRQVQSISLSEARSLENMAEYHRYITSMESTGKLNRALEFLPDDDAINERKNSGRGLSRPELSVLISYSKAELKETLAQSGVADDAYLGLELFTAFPKQLIESYPEALRQHRLYREIVATQLANHMINMMGINFADRLRVSTGADDTTIARAFVLARDAFNIDQLWQQIEALDYQVDAELQANMMLELQHLMRRTTRWFVRNRREDVDCGIEVEGCRSKLTKLIRSLDKVLCGAPKKHWEQTRQRYEKAGVPGKLARTVGAARILFSALGIIDVARSTDVPIESVAQIHFDLGERLDLHWLGQQLHRLSVSSYWQAMAREAFRDDLDWQHSSLVANAIHYRVRGSSSEQVVDKWYAENEWLVARWLKILAELKNADQQDYAMYSVALRELFELAKTSQSS
ncbi:NAD-glutamate dehydrogenase [Pontibacter sp. JAM-7]|uniref:NAD-glutamate dehydrogenase n=1 Tax=Pontibacter sp. JAM-7 TaxID=3366581 RepID=UPI003AF70B13